MLGRVSVNEDVLDELFDQLEEDLGKMARGIVVTFWTSILNETPQYAGRMAASWNFTLNSPSPVDRSDMVPSVNDDHHDFIGRQKGDRQAINIANVFSQEAINGFVLGDVAWIVNGADHGEGRYALDVEEGRVKLRPVNRPGTMVVTSLARIDAQFSRGVDSGTAKSLMERTV